MSEENESMSISFASEFLPEFVDGLKELMGNSFKLTRVRHATFQGGFELDEWKIEGIIEEEKAELLIQIFFLDFHFFIFETHPKISLELLSSAPIFRISVKPSAIVASPTLIKYLKELFDFLNKKMEPSFSEQLWELYSNKEYLKFYDFITPHLKRIDTLRGRTFCTIWAALAAKKAKRLKESADLYEKAAALFGLLSLPWFSYLCLQRRLEIRKTLEEEILAKILSKRISKMPHRELISKRVKHLEVPQELLVTPIVFDYDAYKILLERTYSAKTNDEKKKTLERLAAFLFSSIDENISVLPNIRTTTEEIDLLLKNESSKLFWQRMGTPILVECKNWSKPVGTEVLRDFKGKMETQGVHVGILVSLSGVTKAVREYLKGQRMINNMIILIDKEDLNDVASAKMAFSEKVSERYYWLFTI